MASINLVRVAILDDYQRVALKSADWSSLKDRLVVDVYSDTLADEEALAKRLESYNIICAMRERTAFRASLLDKLPNLKLIATTGMKNASIDVEYAKKKGIVVSGTVGKGNSTVEHTWALILAAARYIVEEDRNVKIANPQWQSKVRTGSSYLQTIFENAISSQIPLGLQGRTLGLIGVGRLGSQVGKVSISPLNLNVEIDGLARLG